MTVHGSSIDSAEARIIRSFARFLSAGALFFGVLLIPSIVAQSRVLAPWWTPLAVTIVFGPLLALWPASFAPDLRWIHRMGALAAGTYLVAGLGWLVALQGSLSPTRDVWLSTFPGLVTMAAALGWRPAPSVLYLVVSACLAEELRHVSREAPTGSLLLDTFNLVMFCSLFVLATITAVETGRTLDRAVVTARRQSAATAAIAATDVERKRFDALIHDRVMSTLLGISRHGNTEHLSEQSGIALHELDRLRTSDAATEDLEIDAAVAMIRTALVDVDGGIPIDVEVRIASLIVPREAVRAIATAAAEALRNSLRHADHPDRAADRLVVVDVAAPGLRVMVADNGRGFDPDRVPPYRLGIGVSIRARMAAVAGCSSEIRSAPERGTQVTLRWAAA
ncbi:sensor histidine kinase [Rhodococcus maanshanensis]|uniref:Signal transduction histidine kinase n=1 Tax=Rhodococcus maanshanensis TaxID=183556 RepID=A0A1H7TAG9_9NOCA|nr:ATP-binding protein [Rhodococcus maanshanensis]SEL81688.1 Signal transduction histidine kinase [Rhodococcus maanshanensis]